MSRRSPTDSQPELLAVLRGCVVPAAANAAHLNVVLYGSHLAGVADARDVDVWCDGPPEVARCWAARAQAVVWPLQLDVAYAWELAEHPDHAEALRWWAARGAAVLGFLPESPPLNYEQVCAAFSRSAHRSAAALVMHARVLALARHGTAHDTAAAAARGWLRSCATGPEQARAVRRLSAQQVADRLCAAYPRTTAALRRRRWADPAVLNAIDALLGAEIVQAGPTAPVRTRPSRTPAIGRFGRPRLPRLVDFARRHSQGPATCR